MVLMISKELRINQETNMTHLLSSHGLKHFLKLDS